MPRSSSKRKTNVVTAALPSCQYLKTMKNSTCWFSWVMCSLKKSFRQAKAGSRVWTGFGVCLTNGGWGLERTQLRGHSPTSCHRRWNHRPRPGHCWQLLAVGRTVNLLERQREKALLPVPITLPLLFLLCLGPSNFPSFPFLCLHPFFSPFFVFFRAAPTAYGSSQARVRIRAVTTGLQHSHSNMGSDMGSKPSLQPTPQLTATPDP